MNIIKLTTEQQMEISVWDNNNIKAIESYVPFKIPFDKMYRIHSSMVNAPVMEHVVKDLGDGIFNIALCGMGETIIDLDMQITSAKDYNIYKINLIQDKFGKMGQDLFESVGGKDIKESIAFSYAEIAIAVTNYFIYHQQDYEVLEVKERNVIKKKGRYQYATGKNAIKITRVYRLAKPVVEGDERKRIKREITCEAWGVRGHYRRYKNGKVIFIKPYVKGKKRDEVMPKDSTYKI